MDNTVWPKGLKKTRPRSLVLEILNGAKVPLTAVGISDLLQTKDDTVWLSTIYRVLDTFVQYGIIEKTTILDSAVAIYERASSSHRHYAVCISCHGILPIVGCPIEQCHMIVENKDFCVIGHKLQLFGYCADCTNTMEVEDVKV